MNKTRGKILKNYYYILFSLKSTITVKKKKTRFKNNRLKLNNNNEKKLYLKGHYFQFSI